MNYYTYKIKTFFLKLIFKIGFIKKWYIGNEYLKNPPSIQMLSDSVIKNIVITNAEVRIEGVKKVEVSGVKVINTIEQSIYF